jgi:UDP-N-acetylglucosamine 3-dehydrogenase
VRIGLCGLGEIGQHHLAAIRTSAEAELVAVCDVDADLAERSADGARAFTSVQEMLSSQRLEAVDVCLPHILHREVALEALEAGCHVLLEKPLAVDLEGCDEIALAARSRGLRVGVSHNQIFYGPHRRLREMTAEGAFGEIRAIYARLWLGGRYGGWRQDPVAAGGGLLMDAGVHRMYMLRALGGPVRAVTATMDAPRDEQSFAVTLEFESGALGIAQAAYHGPEGMFDDRIDLVGTEGAAAVAGCEAFSEGDLRGVPALATRLGGSWRDDPVSGSWEESVRDSVQLAFAAFARDEEPPVGIGEGRGTLALIEAAYRSAERGVRIEPTELEAMEAL